MTVSARVQEVAAGKHTGKGPSLFNRYFPQIAVACVLLISFVWTPSSLPHVDICAMRNLTGLPCPGCGLTRAFCAISHGQFGAAFGLNPFAFAWYAGALVLLFWPLLRKVTPRACERIGTSRVLVFGVPALVAAMIVYGVARVVSQLG